MSCFKVVKKYLDNQLIDEEIEINHPPEAIEEVEVPVFGAKYNDMMKWIESPTDDFIKLKACKECGLYVREDD